jgi:hypothetical protein
MLAFMAFDTVDRKVFRQNRERLVDVVARQGDGRRGRRFVQFIAALDALLAGTPGPCIEEAEDIATELRTPGFDLEAASHLLGLLARMQSLQCLPAAAASWVQTIAQRFCISKATSDLLCTAARGDPGMTAAIQAAQAEVTRLAEQAMGFSVKGDPAAAVRSLIASSTETLNAKLIDLAALLLEQNAAKLTAHASFGADVAELKKRCGDASLRSRVAGANGRKAGGLQLRTGKRRHSEFARQGKSGQAAPA